MKTLALSGVGIVMLPEWYVGESIRQKKLVRLFEQFECAPNMAGGFQANVWALYHQSRRKSLLLRAFLDLLVRSLKHGTA